MALWDTTTVWSFMLLLTGAVDPDVTYPGSVCAVRGSTVTLLCSFSPLESVTVREQQRPLEIIRVLWCKNHSICHGSTPSVYDSNATNNNPRYKYLGDKKNNCTLQITDIQKDDDETFRFRMEGNVDTAGHWTGQSGVRVYVKDGVQMKINSSAGSREMRKGETVTLRCFTELCTFHQLDVTWFRDGHALSESGPALQLGPLAAGDSGNYTCGLKNKSSAASLPYSLQVEKEEGGVLPVVVGVVFGVLLALLALVCIIKRRWRRRKGRRWPRRRSAADKDLRSEGGEVEQKPPDGVYSNVVVQPLHQEGGHQRRGSSQAVDDVSYVSVQFKHRNQNQNQPRSMQEAEDATVYSSVVSRG